MWPAVFIVIVLGIVVQAFRQARRRVRTYGKKPTETSHLELEVAQKLLTIRNTVSADLISPNIAGVQAPDLPAPPVATVEGDSDHEIRVEEAPRPPWLQD